MGVNERLFVKCFARDFVVHFGVFLLEKVSLALRKADLKISNLKQWLVSFASGQ